MGTVRGSHWSITINNPTEEDYNEIELLKSLPWVKKWEGQLEHPEGGILHIQAKLHTERCRWGKVKEALTRAHIEVANNVIALANYVHKPDTRVSELPTVASRFMNVQLFYKELAVFMYYKIAAEHHLHAEDVRNSLARSASFTDAEVIVAEWKKQYKPLDCVTQCAQELIERGTMGLEYIISNPQTKTMFKTFFWNIIVRSSLE